METIEAVLDASRDLYYKKVTTLEKFHLLSLGAGLTVDLLRDTTIVQCILLIAISTTRRDDM